MHHPAVEGIALGTQPVVAALRVAETRALRLNELSSPRTGWARLDGVPRVDAPAARIAAEQDSNIVAALRVAPGRARCA